MQDGYDQTLSGLLRKRGELAGQVVAHRDKLNSTMAELDAIDAAIRVFNPSIEREDLPEGHIVPIHHVQRGEMQRFLLDLLRRSDGPVRTSDATVAVMAERELDRRDKALVTLIRKRVGDAFSRLRQSGHVTGVRFGSSNENEWRLALR